MHAARQKLFCSRDRLGIKPLYYSLCESKFIFCSELKGIRSYLHDKTSLNENKIREYLIQGQITTGTNEETILDNIYQLKPGNNLIFDLQRFSYQINRYWEVKIDLLRESNADYYIQRFTELFRDSIKLRLRSDVEVGSCLSGGIDSSSIVSFASMEFNKRFHTFSAIWPGEPCDESKYIGIVNKNLTVIQMRSHHHWTILKP